LVYAVAPPGVSPSDADEAFNQYISDIRRGICVSHDHFIEPSGGFAVFDVRSESELAFLDDPGPLTSWRIEVQPLAFSLSALGFVGQVEFTLKEYRGLTLEDLRRTEPKKKRDWWRRHDFEVNRGGST
jgi:hypothetical protein